MRIILARTILAIVGIVIVGGALWFGWDYIYNTVTANWNAAMALLSGGGTPATPTPGATPGGASLPTDLPWHWIWFAIVGVILLAIGTAIWLYGKKDANNGGTLLAVVGIILILTSLCVWAFKAETEATVAGAAAVTPYVCTAATKCDERAVTSATTPVKFTRPSSCSLRIVKSRGVEVLIQYNGSGPYLSWASGNPPKIAGRVLSFKVKLKRGEPPATVQRRC